MDTEWCWSSPSHPRVQRKLRAESCPVCIHFATADLFPPHHHPNKHENNSFLFGVINGFCRSNDARRPALACNGRLFLLPHVPGVIAGQAVLTPSRTHLLFDWVQQRRATNAQHRLQRQHAHPQQQQQHQQQLDASPPPSVRHQRTESVPASVHRLAFIVRLPQSETNQVWQDPAAPAAEMAWPKWYFFYLARHFLCSS